MTAKMISVANTVAIAESRIEVVVTAVAKAKAHVADLEKDLAALGRELYEARVAADRDLPRAVVRHRKTETEVVITRRTATTVYTRDPGTHPKYESAWRQSAYQRQHSPEQWSPFPKEKVYTHWDVKTLVLKPEGAA